MTPRPPRAVADSAGLIWDYAYSHNQLTDLYLLALAVKNGGRLVTFDRRIPLSAVHGARAEHLVRL